MIYTSYFAKIKKLPANIVPISICGKAPDGYTGLQYKKLAPKWSFFSVWKQNHDNDYYIQHFKEEVLNTLDVKDVMNTLMNMAGGNDIALICYEKPNDFCHRHLVAEWLRQGGFECEEYNEKDFCKE